MMDAIHQGIHPHQSLEEFSYLPVNLFKELPLVSIPKESYFKTLLSSGTTGGKPSQIILDAETAHRQTTALASIMKSFLGPQRLPMLIIDNSQTISNPKRFSARSAGIIGMSHFGRNHCYALDESMNIDLPALSSWLKEHGSRPFFIFGFTYIIWQHLLQSAEKHSLDFSNAILFHSGGWKKLEQHKVDNITFKKSLKDHFGLTQCHSFYGMVEQVGSIFVECSQGNLHCPNFAEVIIRNPKSWKPVNNGSLGVVQVISLLPTSYPGHSLLTEDLGTIYGVDNCPCGRKGKFFWITGRIPQTAPRGCGDTYAIHHEDSHVS
jgi:hypothetical protein